LMEYVLAPAKIDQILVRNARIQYQREVLFSTIVDVMSLVVCGAHPSVNAPYRAKRRREEIRISIGSLYEKL
jgi:hypothetical protein